jgi:hypothetical protein
MARARLEGFDTFLPKPPEPGPTEGLLHTEIANRDD